MSTLSNTHDCHSISLENKKFEFETIFFNFLIYSFAGWILENIYSLFTRGIFFKNGFLYGPFKPMYGFALIILLFFKKKNIHWFYFAMLCFIIPTSIEYITGWILHHIFHYKFWDYSHLPLNLHSYICLQFSIYWLVASELVVHYLHPYIKQLYQRKSSLWRYLFPFLLALFSADLLMTLFFQITSLY